VNPLRIVYVFLGLLFVGLGAIGVVLPVLPTTPFLLLALFFFSKGSQRFEKWFTSTKLYQKHLESFMRNRSMTRKTKFYLQAIATVMILISVIVVPIIPVKVFLIALLLFMYYYFARRIKTVTPEEQMIILKEEEVWRASREPTPTITLSETIHEVKEMHEEILEKSDEQTISEYS